MKERNLRLLLDLVKPPTTADAKIEVMAKSIAKRQQKMKEYARQVVESKVTFICSGPMGQSEMRQPRT